MNHLKSCEAGLLILNATVGPVRLQAAMENARIQIEDGALSLARRFTDSAASEDLSDQELANAVGTFVALAGQAFLYDFIRRANAAAKKAGVS